MSEAWRPTFLGLSVALLIVLILCFVCFAVLGPPSRGLFKLACGAIPFGLLWGVILMPRQRISDENMVRAQMHTNCKYIGLAVESYHDANRRFPSDVRDGK